MNRRAAIATLLSAALPRAAAALEFGPKQLVVVLLRILAYDRNLKARTNGKEAPILLLYQEGNPGSETLQTDLTNVLEDLASTISVAGLPIKVAGLPYSRPLALEARLLALHPVAVFVCPGLADAIPQISAICRKRQVLTVCSTNAYLKSGLSVGISASEERLHIAINLPASRAEGVDFDAALMRTAEVYR